MDLRFRLVIPRKPLPSDITEQDFLCALNDESPRGAIEKLSLISGHELEEKEFQRVLKGYVDQWIETGVSEDGREDLTERGFYREALRERGQIRPYALKQAASLLDVQSVVLEVFHQKPQAAQSEEGLEVIFATNEPKFEHAPLMQLAEREAKRFFVWFLASELRAKLGKCRICGRYEKKGRKFYKRGTHCRSCLARKSAREITQKNRRALHEKRTTILAAVLKSWKGRLDPKDVHSRKRLADQVNRRLKGAAPITSKWLKRNIDWRNLNVKSLEFAPAPTHPKN
jgi:hypothetical protein